jgi:uncharacterized protein
MSARAWRLAGALVVLVLASGCATPQGSGGAGSGPRPVVASASHLAPGTPLRSSTLQRSDAWLRHYVMTGQQDSIEVSMEGRRAAVRFGDDLQRQLQLALALHHAGDYSASNRMFEEAEREAEARYSRSVRQLSMAMVTSDRSVDWVPSRAEMSMIPYYRMSNYLRKGDLESALIEARKANAYMARIDGAAGDVCRSSTFLKYLTGLLYEIGGEHNDAAVSMRQAEQGFESCRDTYGFGPPPAFGADLVRITQRAGLGDVAADARRRYRLNGATAARGTGEVVVLIENGFVAHRAEQAVYFPIMPGDVEGLSRSNPLGFLLAGATLSARVVNNLIERDLWGAAFDDLPEVQLGQALDGAYVMKMAWPSFRLESNGADRIRVVGGGVSSDAVPVQDVSAEIIRDFEAQRLMMITRTVSRGVFKYVGSNRLQQWAAEKNYYLGELVGIFANAGANALERADTRSWSLLPDQLAMARMRLPAGEHELRAEVLDARGEVVAVHALGRVNVAEGNSQLVTHRVWGEGGGDVARLARAASGVSYYEVRTEEGEVLDIPTPAFGRAPALAQGAPPAASAPSPSGGTQPGGTPAPRNRAEAAVMAGAAAGAGAAAARPSAPAISGPAWLVRGEALEFDGHTFSSIGEPVAGDLSGMESIGEVRGATIYPTPDLQGILIVRGEDEDVFRVYHNPRLVNAGLRGAGQIQGSNHLFALYPAHFLVPNSFGFEYEFTLGEGIGYGLYLKQLPGFEMGRLTTLAVRFNFHGRRLHRGFSGSLSLGAVRQCYMCADSYYDDSYGYAGDFDDSELGMMLGVEPAFSLRLGPALVRLGAGLQGNFLFDSEDLIFNPTGGLSVGWVLGR